MLPNYAPGYHQKLGQEKIFAVYVQESTGIAPGQYFLLVMDTQ